MRAGSKIGTYLLIYRRFGEPADPIIKGLLLLIYS